MGPPGTELIPSGPTRVHFVVTIPRAEWASPGAPGPGRLVLEGYEDRVAAGVPILPQRVLMVAVPPEGPVRVSARGYDPETIDGTALVLPSEAVAGPERRGVEARARVLDVSWMRHQRVARILVTPADYDASSAAVTLYRRIDIEVEVAPAADTAKPAEDPDPFEGVYRDVVVNYEQGKRWRRPASDLAGAGSLFAPGRTSLFAPAVPGGQSVLVGHSWAKIPIPHSGFYRVDFGALRLLDLFGGDTNVSVDSLRLFTWPGFPVLTETNFCDVCDYREVSIGIIDGGDGVLNGNDEGVYFFALGASDWADLYDPSRPDTVFINHPYETRNYYYLTISTAENPVPGPFRRMARVPGDVQVDGDEITPTTFQARSHFEIDSPSEYFPDASADQFTVFWEKWFWRSLNMGLTFTTTADLPGADTTQAGRLRLRLWGLVQSCDRCICDAVDPFAHVTQFTINNQTIGPVIWAPRNYRAGSLPFTLDTMLTNLRTRGNSVQVTVPNVNCANRTDRQGVAWFDFFYPRRFEPDREVLAFDAAPSAASAIYRIGPFAGANPPRVFDVTSPYTPFEIGGGSYGPGAGGNFLSFETPAGGLRRYRVIQDTSIVELTGAAIAMASGTLADTANDLRSVARSADYVVVYYDGFKAAADTLAAWRRAFDPRQRQVSGNQGLETLTVPISALYDQFSGGRTDPAAIRNMLRAAFLRWSKRPTFVTLLGDASYDFKNYKGRAPAGQPGTLVPSFENGFDSIVVRQFATDDWMLNVADSSADRGPVPDFIGGRIPAGDPASAMEIVRNKVLFYERSAPLGEYRNRLMFIADDQEQGSTDDALHWAHVYQTSILDTLDTPRHIDRAYVYLHTYPDEAGETKPKAKAEIIHNINTEGVTIFNYVGHGSPFQLSDERVFLDTDVGSLINAERLPLFVAASCDVGKFNDPTVLSLGERLIARSGGGAIGVISATELAFSGANAALNGVIYNELFRRDSTGQYHTPVAEALLKGKSGSQNSQKYQLMGDAATVLNLPHLWVEATLYDSAGTTPITNLPVGQTVVFRGQVRAGPGRSPVSMEGVASVLIEDSVPIERTPPCPLYPPGCTQPLYPFRAAPMFRGEVALHGGTFQGRFVVPLEARQGLRGRFRAYVRGVRSGTSERDDGVGDRRAAILPGTAPVADQEGPRITLSFQGGSTVVRPDAVLQVFLYDPSGILITGHSRQNGIIVTLDDNSTQRFEITSSFRYAADSYQSGIATFQLPGMATGRHRIRVSAADNVATGLSAVAHRSSATIEFEVQALPPLGITQAVLFPNPIQSGAGRSQFVIDAPGDPVNVLLRIYTVSGRLVRVLKAFGGQGQVQIPWDGLDEEGQNLANGVYLFKVNVNVREPDGRSSPRQKADAKGRFIVVGH